MRKSRLPCMTRMRAPPRALCAIASRIQRSPPRAAGPRRKSRKTRLISGRASERCRSEMNRTAIRVLDDLRLLDDDVVDRHVAVEAALAGAHGLDLVDHVLAFDHLAEDAVAPAFRARAAVVQEGVVLDVDEEL